MLCFCTIHSLQKKITCKNSCHKESQPVKKRHASLVDELNNPSIKRAEYNKQTNKQTHKQINKMCAEKPSHESKQLSKFIIRELNN
jgi:carotenoid cleavage dioxygenase-like enzyme